MISRKLFCHSDFQVIRQIISEKLFAKIKYAVMQASYKHYIFSCHCCKNVSRMCWYFIQFTPSLSFWYDVLGVRYSGVECHYVFIWLIPWYRAISSWWLWLSMEFLCSLLFIWPTYSGFLKLGSLVLQLRTCLGVCAPGPSPLILDWTCTFEPLYVMFRFITRVFYSGVSSFATDCPCGVWFRGQTRVSCTVYVDPLFGNLVRNHSLFTSLT